MYVEAASLHFKHGSCNAELLLKLSSTSPPRVPQRMLSLQLNRTDSWKAGTFSTTPFIRRSNAGVGEGWFASKLFFPNNRNTNGGWIVEQRSGALWLINYGVRWIASTLALNKAKELFHTMAAVEANRS